MGEDGAQEKTKMLTTDDLPCSKATCGLFFKLTRKKYLLWDAVSDTMRGEGL